MQFNLKDNSLYYLNSSRYQNSLVSDRHPQYFEWVHNRPDLPTFYTYSELDKLSDESEKNVILLESTAITPNHHKWVWANQKQFNKIYTHNSDLLSLCPNARWVPGGGIWIGTEFGGGSIGVHDKNKLCSFVSSDKHMCTLHNLRFSAFEFIRRKQAGTIKDNDVALFGLFVGSKFVKPVDYLQDYMYSIIFENYQDDLYFTEKILNCFATGTIPIYLGARNIGSKFNEKGIIKFSNVAELVNILRGISKSDYSKRLPAIYDNLKKCQEFTCVEDYMWNNYMKDEYERRNPA